MSDAGYIEPPPAMQLSPGEQYLYYLHQRNLYGNGKVVNRDGSISTLMQAVVTGPDGRFYNIPTVWDGKVLPVKDAIERVRRIGWQKFPSYDSSEAADARYADMHKMLERDVTNYEGASR